MIDHVSIAVSNLATSAAFYDRALAPLGLTRLAERPTTVGYGKHYPEFWLNARPEMEAIPPGAGAHVCLRAPSAEAVRAFHAAALAAGGRDDGAPGERPATMTRYYGAFVLDPDGNRIEAVTFPREA